MKSTYAAVFLALMAVCSHQIVNGSPLNNLVTVIQKLAMNNDEVEAQVEKLILQAIVDDLAPENEANAVIEGSPRPIADIQSCQNFQINIPLGQILVRCEGSCTMIEINMFDKKILDHQRVCYKKGIEINFVLCMHA